MMAEKLRKLLFTIAAICCLLPQVSTATALISGIAFSLILGNPWPRQVGKLSKVILQLSVVGLGFGLSLGEVLQAGRSSVLFTVVGIGFTLTAGWLLGRLLGTARNTSALISFGTAICGGSAIAAMAPVLKAEDEEIAVSLATIFTLNSLALILFPAIGRALHLDQDLFGIWAGLAIHDTSSVVGAAASYGSRALAVGTTVKLTRAVWITPLVLAVAWFREGERKGVKVPLFIVGFLVAAALKTVLPQLGSLWGDLSAIARQSLVVTLFLIGAGLSRNVLKAVGARPLLQGLALWLLVSTLSLGALVAVGLR